jgi:hypothetical protein
MTERTVALARVAMLAVLLALLARTQADPDLWGHVLGGRDTWTSGLSSHDPYSFTGDIPVVAHSWLAEVVLWGAWHAFGTPGLVAVKMVLVLWILALATRGLRSGEESPLAAILLLLPCVAGLEAVAAVMRPLLFSLALLATLLVLLGGAERDRRMLAAVPFLMAAWANLHGAWSLGLAVLGWWTLCKVLKRDLLAPVATFVAGVAATLATPYGVTLWSYVADAVFVAHPEVTEWRPLVDAGWAAVVVWGLVTALAAVAIWRRRPSAFATGLVVALAVGTLQTTRYSAFYVVAVYVLLGSEMAALAPRATRAAGPRRRAWYAPLVAAAAIALVVAAAMSAADSARCISIDYAWGPDTQATAFFRKNHLEGRLAVWYDWGEYAMWQLGPQLLVSMDPRHDTVYSAATIAAHLDFYAGRAAPLAYLDRLRADWVWLPRSAPVAATIGPPGWMPIFESARSIVWGRPSERTYETPAAHEPPRCFPGDPDSVAQ